MGLLFSGYALQTKFMLVQFVLVSALWRYLQHHAASSYQQAKLTRLVFVFFALLQVKLKDIILYRQVWLVFFLSHKNV